MNTAKILTGLAALLAAGLTTQAQDSLIVVPHCARHGKLGGDPAAQAQDRRITLSDPAWPTPDNF
jgi:hypothetical protein